MMAGFCLEEKQMAGAFVQRDSGCFKWWIWVELMYCAGGTVHDIMFEFCLLLL
jgi:hypothetical protein